MINYFEKCQHCVPPTRKPGCQDHCPHYAEAKAKHDADEALKNKGNDIRYYCIDKSLRNNDGRVKYIKKRPNKKYHK